MDKRKMIVNPDHMSQAGVDGTLKQLEQRGYSGVISPHGWIDPGNWPRIWKLGGVAFPGHSSAHRVREESGSGPTATVDPVRIRVGLRRRPRRPVHAARSGCADVPVQVARRQRHLRSPEDRPAHVRLRDRGRHDLRPVRRLVRRPSSASAATSWPSDMLNGAEAYLEMWERATKASRAAAHASWRTRRSARAWPGSCCAVRASRRRATRAGRGACRAARAPTSRCSAPTGAWRSSAARRAGAPPAGVRVGQRASGSGTRVRGRAAYTVRRGRVIAVGRGANARARMKRVLAPRSRPRLRFVPSASAARVRRPRRWPRRARQSSDAALTLLCGLLSAQPPITAALRRGGFGRRGGAQVARPRSPVTRESSSSTSGDQVDSRELPERQRATAASRAAITKPHLPRCQPFGESGAQADP